MKPSIKSLGDVLYSLSQYVIPVFQRVYRWERPQWEKFWQSLTEISKPDKTGNHFMGFLVFVPCIPEPGQHTQFYLIDGQQRLTTSYLLLTALRNAARRLDNTELADEIHADFLVHPRKKGDEHYRLLPKELDYVSLVAVVAGKTPPAGRIADALAYFEQQFASAPESELRRLFNLVCQRLEFMCATLEAESAYNIFKSLNSTGVPLGPSDLIRNFVFMHVNPKEQDDFDRVYWRPLESRFAAQGRLDEEAFSRFFRDVVMKDGRYVQPKDTFATFESRHEATDFSPATLAVDLLEHANDYATIAGSKADPDEAVTKALGGLNLLDSSTTYPLLLALFQRRREKSIDSAQLAQCIQMIQGFILRRFICGESSRGYGQTFVRALGRNSGDTVADLKQYLLDRGWPDDRAFIDAFVRFPLYKRGYVRAVLITLENDRAHKEPALLDAAQVEHVMPQTLRLEWNQLLGEDAKAIHEDWLHQPGNLTLSAYNQELGNQAFKLKRERFAQSNIVLTRELSEYTTWGADAIQRRGEAMAAAAARLWMGPKEPHQALDESDDDEDGGEGVHRYEMRKRFWSGLLAHLATAHPEVPAFEPRRYRSLRLKSSVMHVGLEVRHQMRPSEVAIDLFFWREAVFPVWEKLRADKAEIDAQIGDSWSFGRSTSDQHERWMSVSLAADSEDESEWPTLFGWLGQKLAQVYTTTLPYLRNEIGDTDDDEEEPGEDTPSATKRQQQRFWGVLAEAISASSSPLKPQKPLPQNWTNYAIGRAGFFIVATVNTRGDRIGAELAITGPNAKEQFHALLANRQSIDTQLGFPVEWQEKPDKAMSRIGCWREDSPPEDESRWAEYVEWLVSRMLRMDEVFRPLLRELP